jgi:hypothetical protein
MLQVLSAKDTATRESLEVLLAWTGQQESTYQEEFLPHVKRLASSVKDEEDVERSACGVYQQATADLNRVCSPGSNNMSVY